MIERDQKITPLASNSIFGTNSPNVYFRLERNTPNFIFNFRLPANTSLRLLDSLYFCHVCSVGRPLFLICLASFLPSFSTSFFGNSGRKCKKNWVYVGSIWGSLYLPLWANFVSQSKTVQSTQFLPRTFKNRNWLNAVNLSTIYFKLRILIKKAVSFEHL